MPNKNASFQSRLRAGLDFRRMTQSELSKRSGVSKSSISRYLSGAWEAKQDAVYLLASALDVSEAWLMGYDVPRKRLSEQDKCNSIPPGFIPVPETQKVPLVGRIACGQPITAEENISDYVDAPEGKRIDFALLCEGDSMIDAGIQDGDVVYIREQPVVENGEIAAVRIGDEATLKRFYLHDDFIELRPANSAYESIIRRRGAMEDVHIEGKAVGWTHWV